MSNQEQIKFLFRADYEISNGLAGGVSFKAHLVINTQTKKVTGMGQIYQAVNPPMNIFTELSGDYSYMCTMESCNILVVAQGSIPTHTLIHGEPQMTENVTLRMSLKDDWQSGVAIYHYLKDGEWIESDPQKVTIIKNEDLPDTKDLATAVKQNSKEPIA